MSFQSQYTLVMLKLKVEVYFVYFNIYKESQDYIDLPKTNSKRNLFFLYLIVD